MSQSEYKLKNSFNQFDLADQVVQSLDGYPSVTLPNVITTGLEVMPGYSRLNEMLANEATIDTTLWVGGQGLFKNTIQAQSVAGGPDTIIGPTGILIRNGASPNLTALGQMAVETDNLVARAQLQATCCTISIGAFESLLAYGNVESMDRFTGAFRLSHGGMGVAGNVHCARLYASDINSSNSLAVAGATTTGSLNVSGASQLNTLNTSGSSVVSSLSVNSTISTAGLGVSGQTSTGTLIVTGALTGLSTISASSTVTGGELVVSNATASTSTSTGALRCTGGIGLLGNLNAGGHVVGSMLYAGSSGMAFTSVNTTRVDFANNQVRLVFSGTVVANAGSGGFQIGAGTRMNMLCYGRTLGQSASVITVSFGTTFSSTPTVVCSIERNDTNYIFTYSLLSVSTTNFTYTFHWFSKAVPTGAYSSADNHLINWVAIG